MIQISSLIGKGICHFFGAREILKNLDFKIEKGESIGLIGKNGEGKSTLLRILAGVDQPDAGRLSNGFKVAYVPQSLDTDVHQVVHQWLNNNQQDMDPEIIEGLRMPEYIWNLPVNNLSGGEQTKVLLLSALSQPSDLLLLDEPTNHLDMNTVLWLEKKLISLKQSVIIVSHDRRFLDEVTKTTWELKEGEINKFSGNYSFYMQQNAGTRKRVEKEYNEYLKEKDRLKKSIIRKQIWVSKGERGRRQTDSFSKNLKTADGKSAAKMANAIKAMKHRLEQLEPTEKPDIKREVTARFLDIDPLKRMILVRGEDVSFGYEQQLLLKQVNFQVTKNARIGLIGLNGSGKSTLLKIIAGQLKPQRGTVSLTPAAQVGYLDQMLADLQTDQSLFDNIMTIAGMDASTARLYLGAFLFQKEDVFRKISTLSYGERVRLAILKLILSKVNMLLLDEPTNHLDIFTNEKIEEALEDYPGVIICASHDRYFLDKIANEIWSIHEGRLEIHHCGFKEFLQKEQKHTAKQDINQNQVKEEIMLLETRIAQIAWDLSIVNGLEKVNLDHEFITLSRQAEKLRQILKKAGGRSS
ncbi:ribosomal protection-like ABC-F family protein [Paenibacillus wynnii]|uniref:ribosomal protection-like ABC-F family protein n=1 Tax=Paenibacillus wynnii TaxID=268407 RepID=UPI00278F69C4|nr:ABC-F type ribosomal protection protein [Paenibacillus wynnii]MDQ0193764.1 ATPase subunit of ABC transporter with duplicated ATPase domains [Paenibacillus wynnii]